MFSPEFNENLSVSCQVIMLNEKQFVEWRHLLTTIQKVQKVAKIGFFRTSLILEGTKKTKQHTSDSRQRDTVWKNFKNAF